MNNNIPFDLSEITDVRVIIEVNGKHYSITSNKEREESEKVDAKYLRIACLNALLKVHDIVIPALEDIK